MADEPKLLEIIRELGHASPPPIRLGKLYRSPVQDYFSFAVSEQNRGVWVRVFELLAEISANIRFINNFFGSSGRIRSQICLDAPFGNRALAALQKEGIAEFTEDFLHIPDVVVLSLYPFNGQPQIADRVFSTLRSRNIEVLGANSATSVISCIVSMADVPEAISSLHRVFLFP